MKKFDIFLGRLVHGAIVMGAVGGSYQLGGTFAALVLLGFIVGVISERLGVLESKKP